MKKLKNSWITKDKTSRLYEIPVPILGLTGGIATGKSTVAQMFRDSDIPVIDADKLVKSIYQKKSSFEFVLKNFPQAIADNAIDFRQLREIVFSKSENQLIIENFIYTQMPEAFHEAYLECSPHEFIVYDVPLLFEKSLNTKIDSSICTYSPRSIQLGRLIRRDNIAVELAEKILAKQMDIEEKKNKSDIVIENVSDLSDLKNNFEKMLSSLIEENS